MVDEIIIRRKRTGEEIKIDKTGDTGYALYSIDWDTPKITNESYRIPFQIGETKSSTVVGTRVPTIVGYVVSNTIPQLGMKWNDYIKMQEEDIVNLKKKMNKFFSIYDEYEIIAGQYYLVGTPTQPISYSNKDEENNEVLCMFTLEISCYNPMFRESQKSESSFYEITNMFRLPMRVTKQNGLIFGTIKYNTIKNVENNGDVETGFIATIKALHGDVNGFVLTNTNTGKSISVAEQLKSGNYIVLNTITGEEDIYMYDVETNETTSLIDNITNDSSIIKLQTGDNYLSYTVGEGTTGELEIVVEHENQYFNIEEM